MSFQMDPDLKLHDLIDFSWSKAALTDILENIDDDFTWLEEILTACKNKFSSSSLKLLPKTPSQKKPARNRARGVKKAVDFEVLSERPDEYDPVCASIPCRSTNTPVRRLRSRSVQSSAATRVMRSSRAVMNKKEEKENTAPGPIMDFMNVIGGNLPSVTENLDVEMIPQTPPTATKSKTVTLADSGGRNVRQKAREYEHMLVGKHIVSSSPHTVQQLVINQKHVQTEAETNNIISHVRRSSTSSRRSSTAGKRKSLKVLASKARLRSLHGKPSLATVRTSLIEQEGTQEIACEASVATGSEETREAEHEKSKNEEPEETKQLAAGKPKASRTRLRLKKSKNDTETASESNSTSGSTTDSAKETDLITTCSNDKDAQPTASTRTKRKKQKSQSSEDEDLKVPAKVAKGSSSRVSCENEVKTRTRTRAQKAENVDCDVSQDDVFEAPEAEGPTKTVSDTTGTQSAGEEQNNEQLLATDSGSNDSGVSSTANATNCVDAKKAEVTDTDSERETVQEELSVSSEAKNATSSVSDSVSANKATDGSQQDSKATDSPRRATRVISKSATSSSEEVKSEEEAQQDQPGAQMKEESASGDSQVEVDAQPVRQTRTKTRQAQAAKTETKDAEKQEVEQTRTTRTKTRKRHADEDADTSVSKRSCMSTPPRQQGESQSKTPTNEVMEIDDEGADADDDGDYEDIETYPSEKVSFLNQLKKKSFTRPASLVSGVVTSFLKQNTPAKPAFQVMQAQKKKELLMKEKREHERLKKMDELKQNKVEEQKRKREERMRKVADMREMRQKKENDLRRNLEEKLKEKLNSTDRMKEDRYKEEREKQRMRLKKQMEAEERRRQEEEERLKKLLEQQEEQKRHEEFLARKREHEELERQKRMAEERKKMEDKQMEMERERQVEKERLYQQELARERERQLQKEQKEKAAQAERAEREKIEMEKRKERELKIQKELEKLKELEQQRLVRMAAVEEEKRREEARLEQIIQQHNHKLQALRVNATTLTLSNATSTTLTVTATTTGTSATVVGNQNHNPNSYPISPVRQRKNGSVENYDIGGLRSDDSTDDDEAPRKKIPSWAQGANLKAMLINQVYNPPDLDKIFAYIEPPNLNEMFERKRPRFNKRTSSAIWNSPLHKPHC